MSQKINKLRADVADKQAQFVAVEAAGAPAEHTRQLLADQLGALAGEYRRDINRLARTCLGARAQNDFSVAREFGLVIGSPDQFIIGALVTHLGDEIAGDIAAEMEFSVADYPPPLADGDRLASLARLKHELRALERQEEAAIEAEELAGNQIERRPDADPVVVLGIPDDFCLERGL